MFVPPDLPCDVRVLTLRQPGFQRRGACAIVPFFDIALEESPNESVGKIRDETVGSTLVFQNPRNDFVRGFAFAATSLEAPATETVRTRFFGGPGRDIHSPAMVETGSSDGAARDDGRRVAAFCGEISIPPGGEEKIAIVFGQAPSRAEALVGCVAGGGRRRRGVGSRRRARPGRSGSARSRCAPTGRTSIAWSIPGSPISSTHRGSGAASGRTSGEGRRDSATNCRT